MEKFSLEQTVYADGILEMFNMKDAKEHRIHLIWGANTKKLAGAAQ